MRPQSGKAPSKLPLILFGVMTVVAFGGPFVIALVLRGGRAQAWPPDRPVEWWTFGLICGTVVVLMIACLTIGFAVKRDAPAKRPSGEREEGR